MGTNCQYVTDQPIIEAPPVEIHPAGIGHADIRVVRCPRCTHHQANCSGEPIHGMHLCTLDGKRVLVVWGRPVEAFVGL